MTLFDRVAQLLAAQEIRHALIGAAALAVRGVARTTYDLELLTTDTRVLDAGLWQPLRGDGATVDIRQRDIDDPRDGVVRIEREDERPVDIVLGKHQWQTRAVERAEHPPGSLPVVAARDLVLLKLFAGATQDLLDIRELLAVPGADRLIAEVEVDLADQPSDMRARWAVVRGEPA
jgi:hypothetical protein